MAAPTLLLLVVFAAWRAANQTPDGLSYALAVRTGVDMFHPHHLLYVPVARLIHLAVGVDPITATLIQNLFWMVVLAGAAWRLAGRILPGRIAPVVAAVGLLALRGVMIYTVRVETYLPALACLALATVLATARPARLAPLVPVLALAILYHQTNVLFVLPLLVLLPHDGRRSAARVGGVLAGAGILVVALYLLAAARQDPPTDFWAFALNYARAPIEAWGNFDYYSLGGLGQMTLSQARMILPVRDSAAVFGSVGMTVALVALVAWHLGHLRRGSGHRQLRLFGLVFLAVYLLFFLWWMPSDTDFFVATLLPLWLLTLIMLDDLPQRIRIPAVGIAGVLLLGVGNLFFTLGPMHRDAGPGRELALTLDRTAPAGSVLVTGYAVQQEMLYFTDRRVVYEFEGLAREVAAGRPDFQAGTVVVVGVPCLRTLVDEETRWRDFLQWLFGYDPENMTAARARALPGGAGVQVGPDKRALASWSAYVAEIRALYAP